MRNLRAIGLAALAFVLSLAATGTASAASVNYGSQTTASVTVFYFNLPASTQLFLQDQISGTEHSTTTPLVSGTGSITISFNVLPPGPGQFYVLARQSGGWVAQSVLFYLFI
jgi:ABC-type glycerol-3-phosphate transport system substrate-binding protein